MGKTVAAALLLLSAGCAHVQPVDDARRIWCDHNAPRRPTMATIAAMSRPELDEMNAFNAKGVEWCGWVP